MFRFSLIRSSSCFFIQNSLKFTKFDSIRVNGEAFQPVLFPVRRNQYLCYNENTFKKMFALKTFKTYFKIFLF